MARFEDATNAVCLSNDFILVADGNLLGRQRETDGEQQYLECALREC